MSDTAAVTATAPAIHVGESPLVDWIPDDEQTSSQQPRSVTLLRRKHSSSGALLKQYTSVSFDATAAGGGNGLSEHQSLNISTMSYSELDARSGDFSMPDVVATQDGKAASSSTTTATTLKEEDLCSS